jgi:replicative DNA helicase
MAKHRESRAESPPPSILGRLPPHDLDGEAVCLSAAMLENGAVDTVSAILKPERMYSDPNRIILRTIIGLTLRGVPVDVVTVASELRAQGLLSQVGGSGYLAQLVNATPAVAHVETHAKRVAELGLLREVIAMCQRFSAEGYGEVARVDVAAFLSQCLDELTGLVVSGASGSHGRTLEEISDAVLKGKEVGSRVRVYTGIRAIDDRFGPMRGGDLRGIWARPKHGKSSFVSSLIARLARCAFRVECRPDEKNPDRSGCGWTGINPALAACTYTGHVACPACGHRRLAAKEPQAVVVFTQEMPDVQYWSRIVASIADIAADRVMPIAEGTDPLCHLAQTGTYEEMQWANERIEAVAIAIRMIRNGYVKIVYKVRSIEDVVTELRATHAQWLRKGVKVRAWVLDYLQRTKTRGGAVAHGNREGEVRHIITTCKDVSLDLDAAGIACAQLNKSSKTEKREARAEDSRDSEAAAMEVDEGIVISNPHIDDLVRKEARTDDDNLAPMPAKATMDVSRHGKTGFAKLAFYPTSTTFTDWGPDEERAFGDEWHLDRKH